MYVFAVKAVVQIKEWGGDLISLVVDILLAILMLWCPDERGQFELLLQWGCEYGIFKSH